MGDDPEWRAVGTRGRLHDQPIDRHRCADDPAHLLEAPPMLGAVDGVHGGPENRDASRFQPLGQIQGCLATELHNHPERLFTFDDFENVLEGEK